MSTNTYIHVNYRQIFVHKQSKNVKVKSDYRAEIRSPRFRTQVASLAGLGEQLITGNHDPLEEITRRIEAPATGSCSPSDSELSNTDKRRELDVQHLPP